MWVRCGCGAWESTVVELKMDDRQAAGGVAGNSQEGQE
jgi:hypothetical protein